MNAFNSIDEGVVLVGTDNTIVLCNIAIQYMFNIEEKQILGWKITDLLQDNDSLLDIYYIVVNGKELMKEATNTYLIVNKGSIKERIAINFKCVNIGVSDESNNTLILFQQLIKFQ